MTAIQDIFGRPKAITAMAHFPPSTPTSWRRATSASTTRRKRMNVGIGLRGRTLAHEDSAVAAPGRPPNARRRSVGRSVARYDLAAAVRN